MSTAAKQRTIKWIPNVGTLTAYCVCSYGKLFQKYTSASGGTYNGIFPDFASLQPVIEFVTTCSRINASGNTAVVTETPTIKFGGTVLTFDSQSYLSTNFGLQNIFQLIRPGDSGSNGHWGLKILQNIVGVCAGSSATVEFTAQIASGATVGGKVGASYDIAISQSQTDGATLAITAVGSDFTLGDGNDRVTMEPMLYSGTNPVTYSSGSDWTIKWYLLQGGTYVQLTGAHIGGVNPWQCTITTNDIGTIGWVKCEAEHQGSVKATAVAEILDVSDGFYIEPGANPADETIVEGDTARNKVTYNPVLYSAKNNQAVDPQPKFHFLVTSAEGVVLNPYDSDTNGTGTDTHEQATPPLPSFEVTAAMCQQANGDVSLFIQTDGTEYQ